MREELRSLIQLGRVEKEIEINEKLKVTVHTLSVLEQQKVMESLPISDMSEVAKFVHLQRLTLIQVTTKINGLDVTIEEAKEFYDSLQYSVLAETFTRYSSLTDDQEKALEELKKK